jgi:Tfp pilus assembly protein PilX
MMLRRLVREESGVAMGLAIMTMVLVGVMGAGLLVFVNTDLTSVLQSNRGQKAFNLADAGVQIAKTRLLTTSADFRNYDGVTNLAASPPNPESTWSCGVWDSTNNVCTSAGHQLTNLDGDPDVDVTVWIQYLKPSTTGDHLDDPDRAPELVPTGETNYPPGRDFFKVILQGSEAGAVRKVEAIYHTYSLGVPKAYYTPGNITLNGAAGSITNISLFAGGNIDGKGGNALAGVDLAYGDWNWPPFNTTARSTAPTCTTTLPDGTSVSGECAGAGALGTVDHKTPGRDFDGTTTPIEFIQKSTAEAPQEPTQITFPFKAAMPDIEALRTAAQSQPNGLGGDNYYEFTSDANVVGSSPGANDIKWPTPSLSDTVVFVKFDSIGDKLTWNVAGGCSEEPMRGTVVVENGIFTTQPNRTPLRGAVVIKSASSPTDVYTDTGTTCMQSFAIATGDIVIGGNVSPATEERGNSPGTYGIQLWSWRECYNASCS